MAYAEKTKTSADKSRAEIERALLKAGATRFAYMAEENKAAIMFVFHDMMVRFTLPFPDRNDKKFTHTGNMRMLRSREAALKSWEQACRSSWRALYLCIRAKLESVESGITTFEKEFLAHFVMPNGRTVADELLPQLEEASRTGKLPRLTLTV